MNKDDIIKHSKQAYAQWCKQWRANASYHKKFQSKSFEDFRSTGIGKAALLVANGYSFEENLETIKKYKDNVDVICCDKTLGHLLDHGITPYICVVCDANVSYEKYVQPWKDKLQDTILFNNVCGNTKWTEGGNWKDVYLYVNKDVMEYEKEFMALSGCVNAVTAGTNVSNMMVVLMVQSENTLKQNLFGYDKLILIGFDYSWKLGGKYYAFDQEAGGKYYYMRHIYGLSNSSNMIYSSNNLSNSASWLNMYIQAFNVPVAQCSRDTINPFGGIRSLESNMKHRHKTSDAKIVRDNVIRKNEIELELKKLNNELNAIAKDHWLANIATL